MSAPAVTITTLAAAVVTAGLAVTHRRGTRPVATRTPTVSGGRIGSTGGASRRRSTSPAASLQWLSPTTGTFAPVLHRDLQRLAS
jgi:hypothetical protein